MTDCDDSSDEAPINNCKSEYWGLGVEHLRGRAPEGSRGLGRTPEGFRGRAPEEASTMLP